MEEKKEKWTSYVALTTVIFAVCATLATFKAGNYSTRSILSQSKASDSWSYFQSKSIKGYLYELQKEKIEIELETADSALPGLKAMYEGRIKGYEAKIKKYAEEKTGIEKEARALEKDRDDASVHSQIFGKAIIFLQIAILLSTISALLKQKYLWLIGSALGSVGIVYFSNGFFLWFK